MLTFFHVGSRSPLLTLKIVCVGAALHSVKRCQAGSVCCLVASALICCDERQKLCCNACRLWPPVTACHPAALQSAASAFIKCCYSTDYKVLYVPNPTSASGGAYVSIGKACLLPRTDAPNGSVVTAARRAGLHVPDLPIDILKASLGFAPMSHKSCVLLMMSVALWSLAGCESFV